MEEWNIKIMGFFRNKLSLIILLFIIFPHIVPSFHYSNFPLLLFFFCAPLKNPFNLISPLDKAGEQGEFTLQKELHARQERTFH
jgi:hypothetical protein